MLKTNLDIGLGHKCAPESVRKMCLKFSKPKGEGGNVLITSLNYEI